MVACWSRTTFRMRNISAVDSAPTPSRTRPHPTPGTPALAGGRPGAPPLAGEGRGGGKRERVRERAAVAWLKTPSGGVAVLILTTFLARLLFAASLGLGID